MLLWTLMLFGALPRVFSKQAWQELGREVFLFDFSCFETAELFTFQTLGNCGVINYQGISLLPTFSAWLTLIITFRQCRALTIKFRLLWRKNTRQSCHQLYAPHCCHSYCTCTLWQASSSNNVSPTPILELNLMKSMHGLNQSHIFRDASGMLSVPKAETKTWNKETQRFQTSRKGVIIIWQPQLNPRLSHLRTQPCAS